MDQLAMDAVRCQKAWSQRRPQTRAPKAGAKAGSRRGPRVSPGSHCGESGQARTVDDPISWQDAAIACSIPVYTTRMASVCHGLREPESWGHRFRQIPDFHVATRDFDKNSWGKLFELQYVAIAVHSI